MTEIAVWGAHEGTAPQFVHTLADAASERVDAGELDAPEAETAVGLPRNTRAISVDEPDRKFTIFVCHPSGATGTFHDHPVDYKISAPEAPVEQNRAFETVLDGTSAVLFLADGRPEVDAPALEALSRGLDDDRFDTDVAVRIALAPEGAGSPDPKQFRERHDLGSDVPVVEAKTWNADDAWRVFIELTRQLRERLDEASRRGLLPV